MQECLALALKGKEQVAPNPMVGCVIVYQDEIIGRGYHKVYGGPHAEVEAIASVQNKALLSSATMYVSLEPCAHFGKTPPCSNLIIEHKLAKVVVACTDPNPLVAGKGIAQLQAAGIEVSLGVLKTEAEAINNRFFKAYSKQMPYTILKWAESADGFMGNDTHRYISGAKALEQLHQWRSEEDAFLVGTQTLLQDNPRLSNRLVVGKQPIRVVVDWDLKSDGKDLHIYDQSQKTFILNGIVNKVDQLIEWIKVDNTEPEHLLSTLFAHGVKSVVIEGGAKLLNSFYNSGQFHEIRKIVSKNCVLGHGLIGPQIQSEPIEIINLEEDILLVY